MQSLSNIVDTVKLFNITSSIKLYQSVLDPLSCISINFSEYFTGNIGNFKHTISNAKFKAVQEIILSEVLPVLLALP